MIIKSQRSDSKFITDTAWSPLTCIILVPRKLHCSVWGLNSRISYK